MLPFPELAIVSIGMLRRNVHGNLREIDSLAGKLFFDLWGQFFKFGPHELAFGQDSGAYGAILGCQFHVQLAQVLGLQLKCQNLLLLSCSEELRFFHDLSEEGLS